MLAIVLLTACSVQKGEKQVNEATEAPEVSALVKATESPEPVEATEVPEIEETVNPTEYPQIGTKIEPLLSERIDTTKQGVSMSENMRFSSKVTKGDDGDCFYFRNEENKIVFYKNNGIKVCETIMQKTLEEKKYYITSFVKYGNYFFLVLWSYRHNNDILTTIDTKTGEWGKLIKNPDICDSIIIYENRFYCLTNGNEITIYDMSGNKTKLKIKDRRSAISYVQCIVDDKIYYIREKEVSEEECIIKIMRCNLDGSNREELFKCSGIFWPDYPGNIKINGKYIYVLFERSDYKLLRIPLYGGKLQGTAKKVDGWFELSDDSIFFYRKKAIYKVDKKLEKEPQVVTKAYDIECDLYSMLAVPFYCADGHLLVKGYNKKEHKVVDVVQNSQYLKWSVNMDVTVNYADDYYWVTEDGEVEDIIKGSGVKERWKKKFKWLRPNSKINLDEL